MEQEPTVVLLQGKAVKIKPALWFGLALVTVIGLVRWSKFETKRLLPSRIVVVTNYMNPESVKVPHVYHTNIIGCISTGYQHWTFVITNQTDEYDVQLAR